MIEFNFNSCAMFLTFLTKRGFFAIFKISRQALNVPYGSYDMTQKSLGQVSPRKNGNLSVSVKISSGCFTGSQPEMGSRKCVETDFSVSIQVNISKISQNYLY